MRRRLKLQEYLISTPKDLFEVFSVVFRHSA